MSILSQLFLQSAQFYTLVLIIVIGLVFIDRRIFLRALSIMLFSMVFNTFLKSLFKIPLKAHFKRNWYAFPSGHANTSATFYGYLIHRFKTPLLTLIGGILIIGICWALVHNHYHDWVDVIAAVGFSILLIFIFHWLETTKLFKDNFMLLILIMTVAAYGLVKISPTITSHTAIPLGALMGVTVTAILEKMFGYQSIHPVIDFLIIIVGILGLQALFAKLGLNSYTYTVLEYGLISWWGTYSPHIFAKLKR
ncbi:phosphatase PAP2 family protein [Candidatus Odyssella acanthamoebae]|uniref:Phosphatidic acid phosphatase type 2/haloperoxidase domain-containing protein n=1 Tax=Candidatus Odyssella acanthamoebae TaxID=91604 RepID=A0A077AUY7_9PROT|nr:phosphatase PAP2 family protein [Candidatus Paracaedibacter acanthamoebae]AIK96977.1 hypothetical protein ID47_09920 [Candidatus Paracaedibacter acanthamoebae]